ncbi:MAG TPA: DUF1629 domain-containing protein [Myxococcaceae bacterium]|nr:DUF1629 domain-containing protein [Myxococcaceae bacterium]
MSDQNQYFDLWDDMQIPGRSVLGTPVGGDRWIDPSQFADGEVVEHWVPMTFEVIHPGSMLDYSMAHMGVPVVNQRAADVLERTCGDQVQLIEVTVSGQIEPFFIANALRTVECVDEQRSQSVALWTEEDGQPAKIGRYRSIFGLKIDPIRVPPELDLFRVARWTVALIASDRLKRAMEGANLIGPKFIPV